MLIFLNDRLVSESEAVVSVFDHGFLYGDGIYETMRAYAGVVFKLESHLARLRRSAALINLRLPDETAIRSAIGRTIKANGLSEAYVRLTVSRGKGPIGLDPDLCSEPTVVVIAQQFKGYDEIAYRAGVRLILARTRRNSASSVSPRIKSLNFLNNILAKMEAKEEGAQEAIMLNAAGFLAEGTVSNIFFVRDGVLCTPSVDSGILDGITREVVLSLAAGNEIAVREGLFAATDLHDASEVFFTNSSAEIMPVSQVEEIRYAIPGNVTTRLQALYRKAVKEYVLQNSAR